jgi:predicted O-methyltransferase YrrM
MILQPPLEQYLHTMVAPRSPLLARVEQHCTHDNIPNIAPAGADFVRSLLHIHGARRILEIGTAYGYSALHWCEAAPWAQLVTVEIDAARAAVAQSYFAEAGVRERVQLFVGDALDVLQQGSVGGTFDFVFIDAAKGKYLAFFQAVLPLLSPRALIVSDNVLFRGLVAAPDEQIEPRHRSLVQRIREYNEYLLQHPRLLTTIVPVGDGLAVSCLRGGADSLEGKD